MAGHATLRHRQLGAVLRGHRIDAGMTLEMVARRLTTADAMSAAKISRIENGQYAVNPQDVRALCRVYRLDTATTDDLVENAAQAMRRGWWQEEEASPLPETYQRYIEYEETCGGLAVFAPVFVPDLLQTAAYTRMLIAGLWPRKTTRERTALAAALTRRQYRFTTKTGPQGRRPAGQRRRAAVLGRPDGDAAAGRVPAGDRAPSADHPAGHPRQPGVPGGSHRVHVDGDRPLLLQRGRPRRERHLNLGVAGPGTLNGSARQRVGFVGGVLGGVLMEGTEEIDRYTETFEHQRAVALSSEETRRWLRQAVKSLGGIA